MSRSTEEQDLAKSHGRPEGLPKRWRREFLDGGKQGLNAKNRPGGELMRTRAKLGEMTMRVELQAELLEKTGYGDELRKLLRRLDG